MKAYVTGSNLHEQIVDDREVLQVLTPVLYSPSRAAAAAADDDDDDVGIQEIVGVSACQVVYSEWRQLYISLPPTSLTDVPLLFILQNLPTFGTTRRALEQPRSWQICARAQ